MKRLMKSKMIGLSKKEDRDRIARKIKSSGLEFERNSDKFAREARKRISTFCRKSK